MYKEYIVKPEHGIVKAKASNRDVALDITYEFSGSRFANAVVTDWDCFSFKDDKTHVLSAVAKCDKDDKFDERLGKDVADMKLDYKIHSRLLRQYRRCKNDLEKVIEEIDKKINYHTKKMWNIDSDYKRVYLQEDK